jgi:hypothetical protein
MDTEATRPRARIGFLRRLGSSSGAGTSLDPTDAVAPVRSATSSPALESLRNHLAMLREREARTRGRPERAAPARQEEADGEPEDAVVPQSLVSREPVPSDHWLKRLFASSRIARYRRPRRSLPVGRHEDVSV